MLKLDRMELHGFKSFCDRTEVRFREGITAVVGPNGCGKSNIGDAINWVLGEQSPKLLRGKQMADVIFGGTEGRKPLGMAEVSLILSRAEGFVGADHGQVVITRRLFRSGDSEYLLNGKRCRLKDIQELLDRGHVGARTYATIEQGKVDQILNAKPKERRLLIEDAAGIAGYKHKRRLTELKLEATHANLLRVNDIVVEVERQIRSLRRQASKARRYRKLRDELRELERLKFTLRARELDDELERVRRTESAARDAETRTAASMSRVEVELETERETLERAGAEFRQASERLHQLEIEIDRGETTIEGCREKMTEAQETATRQTVEADGLELRRRETLESTRGTETEARRGRDELDRRGAELATGQTGLEQAEQRIAEQREQIEALRGEQFEAMNAAVEQRNRLRSVDEDLQREQIRHTRLEEERSTATEDLFRLERETADWSDRMQRDTERVAELTGLREQAERELGESRQLLSTELEALSVVRETEQSAAATLRTLEDVATRFAGVSDGVRTLLASGKQNGVRTLGIVADFVEAGADIERAAEGYLDTFLPTLIVETDEDVQRATKLLYESSAGRTSLISRSQPAGGLAVGSSNNGHGELPPELLRDSRVKGKLRDRLTLNTSANGVLQDRIGDAVLVDDLGAALELHRLHPAADYLTPDGEVVFASGVVRAGGKQAADMGLLAHKRQVHGARHEAGEASQRAAKLQGRVDDCRRRIAELEQTLADHRLAAEEAGNRRVQTEMQALRSTEESRHTGRRTEVLDDELAATREEVARLQEERAGLGAAVDEAEKKHATIERDLRDRSALLQDSETRIKDLSERVASLREVMAAMRQRQEAVENERQRNADALAELQRRIEMLRGESEAARTRARAAAELLARTEDELREAIGERERLASSAGAMERAIDERRIALNERESGLRGMRSDLETARDATREAELVRTRVEADRSHLGDLCLQELGLPIAEAHVEVEEPVELPVLEEQVQQVRDRIERIGPVNMTAIEEFSELEERHAFLTEQREDLVRSMESLKETIRRINRTSRDRFLQAFEAVRQSYQEIFKLLFNGGRADLRLEEGEDVLDCGIEIMVQPPGKRLGNVSLMSGGEKALSAIALLFAVFRFQPSPFCLLDEVDAALDDANVGRFTRMLREYAEQTQFVIVTHNKLSMEAADLLYGVTMDEPGVSRLVSLQLQ